MDATALFRNSLGLHLQGSTMIDSAFLSDAKQLKVLSLIDLKLLDAVKVLSHNFPQLELLCVYLNDGPKKQDEIEINKFLKRHPTLIDLELREVLDDLSLVGTLSQPKF